MYMKTQESKRVCVIGGGAAGLMCAISASQNGADVTLFEKNKSNKNLSSESFFDNAYLGKKLLITGKGRCNVTNDCTLEEFLSNVPTNPKFLYASFNEVSPQKLMQFFEDEGCALKVERGNRVFPVSDKSLDVLVALKNKLRKQNVKIVNSKVLSIEKVNDVFKVSHEKGMGEFDAVVVCTGGASYTVTGSDGDGYKFAQNFGHTVKDIKGSLVPLTSDNEICKNLQGLSLRSVRVKLVDTKKNKPVFSELGEMLFTHFGLSGPLILSASAHMKNFEKGKYKISIDLKPALDENTLDKRVLSDFSKYINKDLSNALCDLLPSKMILPFIKYCGLSLDLKPNSITKEQRQKIVWSLKNFEIEISGTRPVNEAIITSGGVVVKEINPSTLESKLVKGLYFAGEVIDVDAYTGGFNLQIAFSTGYLAGKNAAQIEI